MRFGKNFGLMVNMRGVRVKESSSLFIRENFLEVLFIS